MGSNIPPVRYSVALPPWLEDAEVAQMREYFQYLIRNVDPVEKTSLDWDVICPRGASRQPFMTFLDFVHDNLRLL